MWSSFATPPTTTAIKAPSSSVDHVYGNEVTDYIEPDAFEIVNNFKSLRKLILVGFRFTKLFNLKLYNLEKLILHYCNNVFFYCFFL